ncbi:AlpA family transcriptional regulator [Vibrio sp.]|nr:AlpA family transcriptional regulator [Vibrio sp.]
MKFLKLNQVIEKTSLSRSSIYRKMDSKEFPLAINLGGRAIAWLESDIEEWMYDKIESIQG